MITCYNCGTEVSNLKAFCTNCGTKIELAMDKQTETTETKAAPKDLTESQLNSKLATLRKKNDDFQRQHTEIELKIQGREKFGSSLNAWYQTNTSSFLWRTFSTMKTNVAKKVNILFQVNHQIHVIFLLSRCWNNEFIIIIYFIKKIKII